MSQILRVVAPGLGTTVQDLGRFGHQRFGMPTSGALDRVALVAANLLVGNAPHEGALEMLYLGATLEVQADSVRVAVAGLGASLEVTTADAKIRVPGLQSVRLMRGDTVRVVLGAGAASCILAVAGGLAIEPFMGSVATFARAGVGGWQGRALAERDELPLVAGEAGEREEWAAPFVDLTPPEHIRLVLGPQDDYFTAEAHRTLVETPYTISRAADRMGQRLEGAPLVHAKGYNIVSDGIAPGSIQVPGDGLPIILLADRQTTGGYPKIATVASVDLPALGRLGPGAVLRFAVVGVEEAEALRRAEAREQATWSSRLEPVRAVGQLREALLHETNLISGVAHAHAPHEP